VVEDDNALNGTRSESRGSEHNARIWNLDTGRIPREEAEGVGNEAARNVVCCKGILTGKNTNVKKEKSLHVKF